MARKLNANLVALGSAAIVAVYAAGYAWTGRPPAAGGQAPDTEVATAPAPDRATAIAQSIAVQPSPGAAGQPAGATAYRDGTYSGTGTSRRGDITAEVTVQNGKVASVKITRSSTYYPTSAIARLPAEAVSRQSAGVDFVSGATESSLAFRGAVAAALSQARAPGSAVTPGVSAGA